MTKRKKKVLREVSLRKNLTLPAEATVALNIFKKDEMHLRDAYIYVLRMKGWTLESIGAALGLTRERVRQLEARVDPLHALMILAHPGKYPVFELPTFTVEKEVTEFVEPSPETLARLLELKPIAEKVRSFSPTGREAAEEYTRLLNYAYTVEGVPLYRLAKRLGVTHGAIHFRLVRYGYLSTNGKSRAYQRIIDKNRFSDE
jgi:transcriptional regulator with XRE-family HTH domain